jgi:hypothetical protein
LLFRRAGRLRLLQYGLLFAGVLVSCPAASGETGTLEWTGSAPNVAGYRLYYGIESGDYPFVIDVGLTTSRPVPPNLRFGTTYFFAVKAYNHLGIESDFSAETVYTPRLRIAFMFIDDHATVLSWASEPGAFYRVLATQTLTNPVWVDVSGPLFAPSNTRLWLHVRTPADGPSTFYRVESLSDLQ